MSFLGQIFFANKGFDPVIGKTAEKWQFYYENSSSRNRKIMWELNGTLWEHQEARGTVFDIYIRLMYYKINTHFHLIN